MTAFATRLFLLILLLLSPGGPAAAQGLSGRHIATSLVAESDAPRAGETVSLALVMKPEPGWHGYWKNPGDAGTEPRIDWRLPAGIAADGPLYPVPQTLLISGLMNYVYEGEYSLLVPLHIPSGLAAGTRLPIRGTAHYLACTDKICVPEKAEIALDLTIGDGTAARRTEMFDRYRQALPRPLGSPARMAQADDAFRLAIPLPAASPVSNPYVFPLTDGAIAYAAPQSISRNGDWLIVETKSSGPLPARFDGVLKIGDGDGLSFSARAGSVPAAGTPLAGAADQDGKLGSVSILAALAGALLGGLLLNIMPCVFPILSLKALSLAKSGAGEAAARREALAYTAGVVLTCLALGGALLALRSGGAAIGWAFQLQDPRVILLLLLLVTLIALNLAGLFELPSLAGGDRLTRAGGAAGAFWTGALAAFVATPCTGPFMGAAMGAALVLPPAVALAIFAGLGLGLALPFLLLGFVPALRRKLPRPGPWMARFRRILSLPMFATAIGLAWILERQSGVPGLAIGLAATLLVSAAAWWAGRRQGLLPVLAGLVLGAAALILVPTAAPPAAADAGPLDAVPFSEQRLQSLRAEGRPVFLYFTADWCVTCKVNEKAVLARAEVAKSFADKGVVVMVGDWTRGDAAIGRFLEEQGRSGVPLYLYYAPGKPPEILPQILTVARLTALPSGP